MAANGDQPFIKVTDTNGKPIVGAILHVYEVGTTTNRAIWSDAALTVPMTNPISGANASNASGDFPVFYMAAGLYKLRAETAATTLIWEKDNLDTGVSTGGVVPIASGGTSAITAPAALTALGAAAASDVTALAAQIAAFSASLSSQVSQPQGRLTPTSGTPVISSNSIAAASVFYTPYIGNLCPIWNGSLFVSSLFAELTLTLSASHTLNSIFDVFVINDAGTIRLVTGPAWTTITAGSGARGTGGGTTELVRQSGILVNANAMASARNGASTYSVAALAGTYVGSLYIDGTAGQVTCHLTAGQSRKWGVWNAYNRVNITVNSQDPTATWTSAPTSWRQSRADATNFITVFQGIASDITNINFCQSVFQVYNTNTSSANIGIGINSTTVPSGKIGFASVGSSTAVIGSAITDAKAIHSLAPFIGINNINMLEQAASGTTNNTFEGSNDMLMTASWSA